MKILLPLLFLLASLSCFATRISGNVTDEKGLPLPFASIFVKGSTIGTTTGEKGTYYLDLPAGTYTLVCQYIGHTRAEKKIVVDKAALTIDFSLSKQALDLDEVVIRPGGEDPAYEIMRQAIRKRKDYVDPVDAFTCEAYIKTIVRTEKLPSRFFGQKIEEKDKEDMGVDSAGKGVMFLSESITDIAFKKPEQLKLEVRSGRQSGSSGYGFNFPTFINFYENQVNVMVSQLNPRGFVSPVADNAMNFYRYKYLGSFVEDGKEIHDIQVIARRKYEPLFSGTIRITEGDWRIHSLDLVLTKTSQLQILDSLSIRQTQVPVARDVWRTKDQVVYFNFAQFGIKANGNFLNVYNNYNLDPVFAEKYFNKTLVKYDTAVNKKSKTYWDSIRPVPLETEEIKDYKVKDSLFIAGRDSLPRNLDSLRKRQGPVKPMHILWSGVYRNTFREKNNFSYGMNALARGLKYNTVEGIALQAEGYVDKRWKNGTVVILKPFARYGFSNEHFNAWGTVSYTRNKPRVAGEPLSAKRAGTWEVSGGKTILQFNREKPISDIMNAAYTLLRRKNYMKLYETWFGALGWKKNWENEFSIGVGLRYEDRLPLENTADYSFYSDKTRNFTPNYPVEQLSGPFNRHQSVNFHLSFSWQPGQHYIEYPYRKVAIGSDKPVFSLKYEKGIPDLLGSESNFDKWQIGISDEMNFKLKGQLKYRWNIGGFLNRKSVFIQDYQHFNGNQTLFAGQYLNSFQLAPYYANSTTAAFYTTAHLEHHFNGMLTNKIPLFRRLNWNLVAGGNAFYVRENNNYIEGFAGIENIFKVLRVDVVGSWLNGRTGMVGLRLGLGGLIGGNIRAGNE